MLELFFEISEDKVNFEKALIPMRLKNNYDNHQFN
jgi:hypothetical protein